MIPFSILSGSLTFTDQTSLSFRVLDLSIEGFTFRLSKRHEHREIESISLNFYDYHTDVFRPCQLSVFSISAVEDDDSTEYDNFYILYRVNTAQSDYQNNVNQLSDDYMRYIHLKLAGDDAKLSKALTGYPADLENTFPEDITDFRRMHLNVPIKMFSDSSDRSPVPQEIALSLINTSLIDAFIRMPFDAFTRLISEHYYCGTIPVHTMKITHLYLGHPASFELYPDSQTILSAVKKALADDLLPVIIIPPLRAQAFDAMKDMVKIWLAELFQAFKHTDYHPAFLVNDWGIALWLHEQYGSRCQLILGTLLNKRRKDVRMPYKNHAARMMHLLQKNVSNADFYQQTLAHEFGIESFAYDCTGCPQLIPKGSHELHLPYYIMNTEGFGSDTIRCYPSFLPMIGMDGMLLGLDTRLFKDAAYTQSVLSPAIKRIVLEVV